jgi:hypothetical protein
MIIELCFSLPDMRTLSCLKNCAKDGFAASDVNPWRTRQNEVLHPARSEDRVHSTPSAIQTRPPNQQRHNHNHCHLDRSGVTRSCISAPCTIHTPARISNCPTTKQLSSRPKQRDPRLPFSTSPDPNCPYFRIGDNPIPTPGGL